MQINFGKTIADKLGLSTVVEDEVERNERLDRRELGPTRDRAARLAGLNEHKFTERPTGYARGIRRQRHRDTDSGRRKQRRQALKNQRDREAFYDHAGQIARIYFGIVNCRPEARKRILDRVDAQARNIADTAEDKTTFDDALARIEQVMLANMGEADKIAAARVARRAQRKSARPDDVAKLAQSRIDVATGHPVVG